MKQRRRSPLKDIQQTVVGGHYRQGCGRWVMLADTWASHAALSTAARVQLLLRARYLLQLHLTLSAFIQNHAKASATWAVSFMSYSCRVRQSVWQWDIQSGSNSIVPLDFAKDGIFRFLSHGKGSSHTWYNPRLSFGKIQLCSGFVSSKVEKKAKRGEKEMDLAGNREGSWAGHFSISQQTLWNTTYWDLSQNLSCLTDYEGFFQSILVFRGFLLSWAKFS